MRRYVTALVTAVALGAAASCGIGSGQSAPAAAATATSAVPVATVSSPALPAAATEPIPQALLEKAPNTPDPSINDLPPVGEAQSINGITVQLVGNCEASTSKGNGFRLKVSSNPPLPPGTYYLSEVHYPKDSPFKGKRYGNWLPQSKGYGKTTAAGTADDWYWDCAAGAGNVSDPDGNYPFVWHLFATDDGRPPLDFKLTIPVRT